MEYLQLEVLRCQETAIYTTKSQTSPSEGRHSELIKTQNQYSAAWQAFARYVQV